MKLVLITFLLILPLLACSGAAETDEGAQGDVQIEPNSGEIEAGMVLTITFPAPMIGPEAIDVPNQHFPIASQPALDGLFIWKSQTEGVFTIKRVKTGSPYHLTLPPDLCDLAGKPLATKDWSVEFTTPHFSITADFAERDALSSQPQVALESTYKVRLPEVAEHAYFQDRDSRQRYPVNIIQTGDSTPEAREFRVEPRDRLPVNRTYDLIVDGLLDSDGRAPLPYPRVFPVGKTAPLEIDWIGAFNPPLEDPAIKIKLNDQIDPDELTPNKIRIEPAVENQKMLASGEVITLTGAFDLTQHYRVVVSPELIGERGYGLSSESKWGATFRPKNPSVVFPSARLFVRALQKLRFPFLQINTGPLQWKLARIPQEKLGSVSARLTEFAAPQLDPLTGDAMRDPRTGLPQMRSTELLIQSFGLQVVSSGNLEGSSQDEHQLREVECESSDGTPFSGAYLFEVGGQLPDRRTVGNRVIVLVSNVVLSQKRTAERIFVRLAGMVDAQPVAGITVRAVTDENIELESAVTDQNGLAAFSRARILPNKEPRAALFIADASEGPIIRPVDMDSGYSSGTETVAPPQKHRAAIVTDRNLYRPGQVVKIKGILRDAGENSLAIPPPGEVAWQITMGDAKRMVKEGTATLSPDGTWEASWNVPEKAATGRYQIQSKIGNDTYAGTAEISIEEYRVPLFSIMVEAENEVGSLAHARIASSYFHGAPTAGAHLHWKATWTVSAQTRNEVFKCYNTYPEIGPRLDPDSLPTKTIEGDTKLNEQGLAAVECESPFKDNQAVGLCDIYWRAEITSADGQTLVGGAETTISSAQTRLGVQAKEDLTASKTVQVDIQAFDQDNQAVPEIPLRSELFLVTSKTVKEQVAPFVYRYRNTDQFQKVASQDLRGPSTIRFQVNQTGRYVAAVSAPEDRTPLVSDETTVTGEEPAELPVENEAGFQIEHRPEPFAPGETAILTTKAPFAGVAWVSIETDKILDSFLVSIPGNAGRIEIPVKKEYAPNAFISVYLTHPGGGSALPLERFAYTQIAVQRSDWKLKIEPLVQTQIARPRETIRGRIHVTSEESPIPSAELTVFVVDDAVLQLGAWQLPDLIDSFYYQRAFGVKSYESLNSYQDAIPPRSLTHKGFIIGDGGEEKIGNIVKVRKEFRTLAFWAGALKTDRHGNASFDFVAPDNLTTYRLVVLGSTQDNRFGGDAGTVVKISKPVLVEPALPRFFRNGDEIELRAVVHQSFTDSKELHINCSTDSNLIPSGATDLEGKVTRDIPAVFRFKAKVSDSELKPIKIRFDVAAKDDPMMSDSVELFVPVQATTILRTESLAGAVKGNQFDARTAIPQTWKEGRGTVDVTLSTSPWLPVIAGLPMILEYPHGCFEQISSRLLGYAMLGSLLAFLPDTEGRDQEYRNVIAHGLRQIDDSILEDGLLPYWPGEKVGQAFVSAQALWALEEADQAGFVVPEALRERLRGALTRIVHGQTPAMRFDQVFALFALSQASTNQDFAAEAEELYLRRNEIGDEGRALLALALHRLAILSKEKAQLLHEIDVPIKLRAFDPRTFTSTTRAEAICALAFSTIAPKTWTADRQRNVRERLLALMGSSASLSTQENLWLLLAFKSMLGNSQPILLKLSDTRCVRSKNGQSAGWLKYSLPDLDFSESFEQRNLNYLMRASYSLPSPETDRVDRGIRIERVVRDLSDPKRLGSPEAPFRLGDQVLVTYRVNTQKPQSYLALEDLLPAGLETVNPALAMIAKFLEIPPTDNQDQPLALSHSELRDQATLLYFNEMPAGAGQYSVLARATAVGKFRWPATQISPMYDSRFSGLTPSSLCVVSED